MFTGLRGVYLGRSFSMGQIEGRRAGNQGLALQLTIWGEMNNTRTFGKQQSAQTRGNDRADWLNRAFVPIAVGSMMVAQQYRP